MAEERQEILIMLESSMELTLEQSMALISAMWSAPETSTIEVVLSGECGLFESFVWLSSDIMTRLVGTSVNITARAVTKLRTLDGVDYFKLRAKVYPFFKDRDLDLAVDTGSMNIAAWDVEIREMRFCESAGEKYQDCCIGAELAHGAKKGGAVPHISVCM